MARLALSPSANPRNESPTLQPATNANVRWPLPSVRTPISVRARWPATVSSLTATRSAPALVPPASAVAPASVGGHPPVSIANAGETVARISNRSGTLPSRARCHVCKSCVRNDVTTQIVRLESATHTGRNAPGQERAGGVQRASSAAHPPNPTTSARSATDQEAIFTGNPLLLGAFGGRGSVSLPARAVVTQRQG